MAKSGTALVPERLVNFRVYRADNGQDISMGQATVDLPEIQAMSDTVSGAGIAGEVETPVLGHYQSFTVTLHWRTIEAAAASLAKFEAHTLTIRGSQQVYDAAAGTYTTVPVRLTLKTMPKSLNLGSFEPGSTVDVEQELEVSYLKLFVNGKAVMELDKYNFVAKFGEADALETVRQDLGLA